MSPVDWRRQNAPVFTAEMHPCALGLVLSTISSQQHYSLGLVPKRTETLANKRDSSRISSVNQRSAEHELRKTHPSPSKVSSLSTELDGFKRKKEFCAESNDFNNRPFQRRGVLRDPEFMTRFSWWFLKCILESHYVAHPRCTLTPLYMLTLCCTRKQAE